MKTIIKTSVIGSYPISIDTRELINDYFSEKVSSWTKYIEQAIHDMTTAGINYVSDGQTRDPFVQIFTRKLKGCRIRNRTEIIDHVEYHDPITVHDQKVARQLLPRNTKLIGVITGPYTLTKSSVDFFYNNEKELCFDFATALRNEALLLQKYVDLISIDEPFFSNELPDYAKELIRVITNNLSCTTRLHVCGDISRIIPQLVEMPVDILSHEFKASPQLIDIFKEYPSSKKICVGAVQSDNVRVESIDEIITHIEKTLAVFGENVVQIAPDCGQRLLPREIAFRKLQNLKLAGDIVNGR